MVERRGSTTRRKTQKVPKKSPSRTRKTKKTSKKSFTSITPLLPSIPVYDDEEQLDLTVFKGLLQNKPREVADYVLRYIWSDPVLRKKMVEFYPEDTEYEGFVIEFDSTVPGNNIAVKYLNDLRVVPKGYPWITLRKKDCEFTSLSEQIDILARQIEEFPRNKIMHDFGQLNLSLPPSENSGKWRKVTAYFDENMSHVTVPLDSSKEEIEEDVNMILNLIKSKFHFKIDFDNVEVSGSPPVIRAHVVFH